MITEYDIQAFVDNELSHEREKLVLAAIQTTPAHDLKFQRLRAQKILLKSWWAGHNKEQ